MKYWKYILLIVLSIALLLYFAFEFNLPEFLFGSIENKNGEFIKLIGLFLGGCFVLVGLFFTNKRLKYNNQQLEEQNRQNNISEKAQINARFSNAATLLGNCTTSAKLSGIYALHQIATETFTATANYSYAKVVCDILCAFLRDSSYIECEKNTDEKGNEYYKIITAENSQPVIITQTIIDVLFKNKLGVYDGFTCDLSNTVLIDIDFQDTKLDKVNFTRSKLDKVFFNNAELLNVDFSQASLFSVDFSNTNFIGVDFFKAYLNEVTFPEAKLLKVDFPYATLSKVEFSNAQLNTVDFAYAFLTRVDFFINTTLTNIEFLDTRLSEIYFHNAILSAVNFHNAELNDVNFGGSKLAMLYFNDATFTNVNFIDTLLEGYDYQTIMKTSLEITDPERRMTTVGGNFEGEQSK